VAYETLVAVFDTAAHADAALRALQAGGFHRSDISVVDVKHFADSTMAEKPGLWNTLFGGDLHEHEAHVYSQTVADGGVVLTLRTIDSEVAHAQGILNIHQPVDVHDRAVTAGIAPAAHVEAVERKLEAVPLAKTQIAAVAPALAKAQPDVLRLAEEQLQVGKEAVETGRTRVRRFVTEKEVSADVTLHEEHAEVFRRAVSDPQFIGDIDWADGEIEVIETAEHALVNKTARVVEEIGLKKVGTDHVETIHEKLRRQHAEVINLGVDTQRS